MEEHKTIHRVAIIGGGPKGIYGFERLAAWLKCYPPSDSVEIHVYNRSSSFGAGENYRSEQPSWLLMNNPVGDINMWGEEKPPPVVPNPLSFTEWLSQTAGHTISDNVYSSRAMAGRYLSYGFDEITTHLPENVIGKYIIGEVVDIHNNSGKYTLSLKAEGDKIHHYRTDRYDHILLATGHPAHRNSKEDLKFQSFAVENTKAGYIPFVYPHETVFSDVPPHCSVALKGLGLTFVDAVLALTEGKGGRFERDVQSEKLTYIPSGDEPKVIYPFSRSGLPMIPRISVTNENNELSFFTRSALQKFESGKKLDFEQQIWPLVKQDMIYAYYDIAMKSAGDPGGLSGCADFKDVEDMVADYHTKFPSEGRFDVDAFLEPSQETEFQEGSSHHITHQKSHHSSHHKSHNSSQHDSHLESHNGSHNGSHHGSHPNSHHDLHHGSHPNSHHDLHHGSHHDSHHGSHHDSHPNRPNKTHHQYVKSLYKFYIHEARKGELRSPLAAVVAVWSKASSLFCEVYSFGGFTPESHKHVDGSIRGKLIRVTYGPPVESAEKIYALMESGYLSFDAARNPDLLLDEESGSFILESRPGGTRYPIHFLVDARIPKGSLADDPGPLFGNLLNRGLITIYKNGSGKEAYCPGAVNMTRQGFVIDKNGHINRGIAITGTPTEGITFDNDTLSRDRNNFVDGWAEFISSEYAKSTSELYAN